MGRFQESIVVTSEITLWTEAFMLDITIRVLPGFAYIPDPVRVAQLGCVVGMCPGGCKDSPAPLLCVAARRCCGC